MRAIEDPALVAEIAERGLVLECCPTSNVVLGVFDSFETHPLPGPARGGRARHPRAPTTRPTSARSVGGEYAVARERFGLSDARARRPHPHRHRGELRGTAAACGLARPPRRRRRPTDVDCAAGSGGSPVPRGGFPKEAQCTAGRSGRSRSPSPSPLPRSRSPRAAATTAAPGAAVRQQQLRVHRAAAARRSRSASSPTSAASTTARSTSSPTRACRTRVKQLGVKGRVLISKQNSDYIPNLTTLAQQKYDLIIGNGFLMADAVGDGRQEVPAAEVRDHRLVGDHDEGQAAERRRAAVQGAGGRLPRRLPDGAVRQGQRRLGEQRRRPEDPAGRPLHRGLPGRREEGRTRASRRSTATPRASPTRRSARRSHSTRSPRARRSSSRWPARAGSARSTPPRRRACRRSASTPTRPTSGRRSSRAR